MIETSDIIDVIRVSNTTQRTRPMRSVFQYGYMRSRNDFPWASKLLLAAQYRINA